MSENEHRKKIEKMAAHKPPKSGCVTRCQGGKYIEKEKHSHRWNAAVQARSEKKVYTIPLGQNADIPHWGSKALKRLGEGLIGIAKKHAANQLKPFYRSWWPFPHNAHHIIPVSVLWNNVIDVAVAKANDTQTMFDEVIIGFLTEPYNHNDRPNMITLPTRNKESNILGLPMHTDGRPDHPDYSTSIETQVTAKIPKKYNRLAKALNKKGHVTKRERVKVKRALVGISKATYKAIITLAKSKKLADQHWMTQQPRLRSWRPPADWKPDVTTDTKNRWDRAR
jgi:hypothetical protein